MAFISSSNTSSGKAASLSHDTICAYIATQSNGSQIKYEDITQIDKDDIEEIDIKWNMALLNNGETWPKDNYTHKSMTPRAVLLKPGTTPIVVSRPNMNVAQPKIKSFAKPTHSNVKRSFQRKSAVKNQPRVLRVSTVTEKIPTVNSKFPTDKSTLTADLGNKGKVVKASACWIWRPKQNTSEQGPNCNSGNPQNNIVDKGYWDSGCSLHITRNISFLSEYKPYDGGYVLFGHRGRKITGKGIIKTGKLEFENVYFVKKLKTPRQHNMHSIDLNNIFPHKNLTCLVAKASVDERKQHKASCKTKLVNSVSKPFHTLHIDLFGPTSVSSLNHKWYCLVVTDDLFRTPQQNGVAERRNETLTEAARTMLANAKLPVTFWAEKVNTVCYVQNRVLVNKSQNQTLYELFNSRIPAVGFLRPFGCHVMILNALDHLGKFDAKGDEGYFVGYSFSSKASGVFNKRTKKVEDNLHVDFLENKLIEKGAGLNWLFDIDTLTNSMNYVPVVVAGTSSTNISVQVVQDSFQKGVLVKKEAPSLGNALTLSNRFEDTIGDTTNAVTLNEVEADLSSMETSIPNPRRKSTNGGCQFLGRRLISWQCKKQTIVATFTTEAEYVPAASGCGQVL
nr:ribonuclease H-like domain-containing protein [Tanacetum cinerariifolium]